MVATTTPLTSSVLPKVIDKCPGIKFEPGDKCAWNPRTKTVYYHDGPDEIWGLLHEVGHALLGHDQYRRDIELLGFERDAWQRAASLAEELGLQLPADIIEEYLDTYRDWLHARSTCVDCGQTGIQTAARHYSCPHCQAKWSVNDARTCALRRYRLA